MGVRGVTDLMVMPGLINLDFADIRTVMSEMGKAMMGTGEAEGEKRAIEAAEAAISNPLLDDVSMTRRPRRADQHHRRPRHDPLRGRRRRQPDPRGGRLRRQHHLRLDLRQLARRAGCGSRWWRPASTCRPIGRHGRPGAGPGAGGRAAAGRLRRLPLPAAARPGGALPEPDTPPASRRPGEISPAAHLRAATEQPAELEQRRPRPEPTARRERPGAGPAAAPRSAAATCSRG